MNHDELRRAFRFLGSAGLSERHVFVVRSVEHGGRTSFVRGATDRVTGFARDAFEEFPHRWDELVHPDDLPEVSAILDALSSGSTCFEYRISGKDGEVRWLREELKVMPWLPREAAGVAYDVTGIREVADRLERLEDQVSKNQRFETLGAMAASVAHDFNNLLAVIGNAADLMKDRALSTDQQEELDAIAGATARGSTLVRQLLEFASRGMGAQRSLVNPSDVVRALQPILTRALGEDIYLSLQVEEVPIMVNANPSQLEQILMNLVANARDAMPFGGDLTVKAERRVLTKPIDVEGGGLEPGEYACLSVTDTGGGISPAVRERMFERYVTTKGPTGSGFGLTTVRRLVDGYGGAVEVETEMGVGSTFRIYLPAGLRIVGAVPPVLAREIAGLSVLLVIADPRERASAARQLAGFDFRTHIVGSAREALSAYDHAQPRIDVVITDQLLPDRDGLELRTALQKRTPDLEVAFFADAAEPWAEGSPILRRPIDGEELIGFLIEREPAGTEGSVGKKAGGA